MHLINNLLLLAFPLLVVSCQQTETTPEPTIDIQPQQNNISSTNEATDLNGKAENTMVTTTVIASHLEIDLPNTFAFISKSNQNPGIGVISSEIVEYAQAGNPEITYFFIHTVYADDKKTIDTHYDAIVNNPRANSSRISLERIELKGAVWLYEQYEANEADGTPVMYDDFIFIEKGNMVGATVCCNSDVYAKWKSVIEGSKKSLTVLQ